MILQELFAEESLSLALSAQSNFWCDKVREKWLLEGDTGSRFFHQYAKARRNRACFSLLEVDEVLYSDLDFLSQHICGFFPRSLV